MPARSQKQIRHDLKRLKGIVDEHAPVHEGLAAIKDAVDARVADVDAKWQALVQARLTSTTEIKQRDDALGPLEHWARIWRSVVVVKVPGAQENIRTIPADGATVDDIINAAADIKHLIETHAAAEPFRDKALAALGTKLEDAQRENAEAKLAVPAMLKAAEAFADSTLAANALLVEGSRIVRNIFGANSHEYKRLVRRKRTKSEEEDDAIDIDGDAEDADLGDERPGEAS